MIDALIKTEEEAVCTCRNNIQETKVCWIVPKLFTTDSLWGKGKKKEKKKKPHGKAKASLSILSDSRLTRSSFMSFSGLSVSCLSCSIWRLKWSSDASTVKERCCLKCAVPWILHTTKPHSKLTAGCVHCKGTSVFLDMCVTCTYSTVVCLKCCPSVKPTPQTCQAELSVAHNSKIQIFTTASWLLARKLAARCPFSSPYKALSNASLCMNIFYNHKAIRCPQLLLGDRKKVAVHDLQS